MRLLRARGFLVAILGLLTLAAFFPVADHRFVAHRDGVYVTQNPAVRGGLSRQGMVWAFTTCHTGRWQPMTWLSHQLDVELYGLHPRGHHLTNLVLHTVNVLLLFLALSSMTRGSDEHQIPTANQAAYSENATTLWACAFVAALFAVHPLRVEPVAWVAARGQLLAGLFWMLTLTAYARYARKPSRIGYLMVLLPFVLGLMANSLLVTLPFVLLLLDDWPLARFKPDDEDRTANLRLVIEKLPLLALSIASGMMTLIAYARVGSAQATASAPFVARVGDTLLASVGYLNKTLWPTGLTCLYPPFSRTGQLTGSGILGAAFLLAAITAVVFVFRSERRYLVVGWLWFLLTLVPTSGFVPTGSQEMADRFTYVPLVGLFLMLAWTAIDLLKEAKWMRPVVATAAVCVVGLCLTVTWLQLRHWRDSVSLFRHAVEVAPTEVAHRYLARELARAGTKEDMEEAVEHYEAALRIQPNLLSVRSELAGALSQLGRFEEAVAHYEAALSLAPAEAGLRNNLGSALASQGRLDEAIEQFEEVVRLDPDHAIAHGNLAGALEKQGRLSEAISHHNEVIRILPRAAIPHNSVGLLLSRKDKPAEAISHYREALRLRPDYSEAMNNLAWLLATHPEAEIRNGAEAVEWAEKACQATNHQHPDALDTLAAAYAEAARFADAVRTAGKAAELSRTAGQIEKAIGIEERLDLYRARRPFREVQAEE